MHVRTYAHAYKIEVYRQYKYTDNLAKLIWKYFRNSNAYVCMYANTYVCKSVQAYVRTSAVQTREFMTGCARAALCPFCQVQDVGISDALVFVPSSSSKRQCLRRAFWMIMSRVGKRPVCSFVVLCVHALVSIPIFSRQSRSRRCRRLFAWVYFWFDRPQACLDAYLLSECLPSSLAQTTSLEASRSGTLVLLACRSRPFGRLL